MENNQSKYYTTFISKLHYYYLYLSLISNRIWEVIGADEHQPRNGYHKEKQLELH